jgi:hypothetical protein
VRETKRKLKAEVYRMEKYKPVTIEVKLSKEEFEKLKKVRQLDRVLFLCEEKHECFTVYNLVSDH